MTWSEGSTSSSGSSDSGEEGYCSSTDDLGPPSPPGVLLTAAGVHLSSLRRDLWAADAATAEFAFVLAELDSVARWEEKDAVGRAAALSRESAHAFVKMDSEALKRMKQEAEEEEEEEEEEEDEKSVEELADRLCMSL